MKLFSDGSGSDLIVIGLIGIALILGIILKDTSIESAAIGALAGFLGGKGTSSNSGSDENANK